MEGLPYDFGIEDDSDDEDGSSEKKKKDPTKKLIEAIKAELEPKKEKDETDDQESPESLLEPVEGLDTAPELDAEAPLEHLSRVETEAIAQTLASERLSEINESEEDVINSSNIAAESFLEAVEATGDIDEAYQEIIIEIGEAAIDSSASEEPGATETAMPVDPESLIEQARNELTPNVTYNLREGQPVEVSEVVKETSRTTPKQETKSRPEKLHTGLVEYVVGRRFGRIREQSRENEIETKLESEISDMKLRLEARENHVREIARNKNIDKKIVSTKPEKRTEVITETIVEKQQERTPKEHHTKERAGISAHTMKKAELLALAGKIQVEGTTLRKMYEGNVIGEKALRRVLAEFLRGGNFRRKLRREIVEKEKDFERDPKLRDRGSRDNTDSKTSDLDRLLSKTGINWDEPQPTYEKKRRSEKLDDLPKARDNKVVNPLRRVADIVMIGAIAALATTIAVLIITR